MTEGFSLKRHLGRNLLIHLLVLMLVLLLMSHYVIRSLVNDYVASRLDHDVESLVSALNRDEKGVWWLDPLLVSSVYRRVRSGHYYVIDTPSGRLRSRSLFDFEPDLDQEQQDRFEISGPGDELWLVIYRRVEKDGQPLELWVAEDIHQLQDRLQQWLLYLALILALATLAQLLLQRRLLDRGFSVFGRVQRELKQHRYQPLSFEPSDLPLEITPLIDEINLLVKQLRQRVQRTRNAIGDLAHELKRPLQVLSLIHEQGDSEESAARQQALRQIRQVIDRELKRARISGNEAIGSSFHPQQDIPVLVDLMEKIHPGVQIDTHLDVEGAVALDRDDLLELCGNLLDNAAKFAKSRVILSLKVKGDALEVTVEDDGPGLPEGVADRILKKGVRLDETREGHGLGLRICADIVESYDGRIEFSESETGGLKLVVRLSLPRAC